MANDFNTTISNNGVDNMPEKVISPSPGWGRGRGGAVGFDLSPAQLSAVTYCSSPQLVIAGAGSGKTRVLTYKIAYLLQHYDLKPWNILALTFTNKAAREMKSRIAGLVGEERARYLQMGTFHSVFSHILRVEAKAIGYSSDFTIYDESDSRSLIKNILKQMGLDDKTYKPATVHAAISMAKNHLCGPSQYAEDGDALQRDRRRNMPETFKIFASYQQRLRQANAMDFDDLLVETYRLFKEHEDIRQKYAARFSYVLVDEYQDTNYAQQCIVELLTKDNPHVCVVGDDYQSIYAFRGANIANILKFNKIYPTAKLFKLEQNYRSTKNIVAAANSLMKHNRNQIDKDVYSENAEGEKVIIYETISDKREASIVCREIKRLIKEEGLHYKDFAILYRTNAQSRTFEEEMRKPEVGMGANYRIYGGLSFYQRKEIKDIIAYYRLVVNPDDEEAFRRIINYPARGIGNTTIQKIVAAAEQSGVSLWETICHPMENGLDVNKGTMAKLLGFRSLIQSFIAEAQQKDALTLGEEIIDKAGIKADLAQDKSAEGDARRENVDSLVSGMASFIQAQQEDGNGEYVHLTDYLQTVSLMTDADSDDDSDDKVTLMTIHAAKGLEFNTVFVVGLEENIFPSLLSLDNPKDLEEERRLLYVAITRAEKHCYLTWAHTRWRYGKMDAFVNPSRFIAEIDSKFTETKVEGGRSGSGFSSWGESSRSSWGDSRSSWGGSSRDEDYEIDRPYTGYHAWGDGYTQRSSRMQNSRPVAGQFMADPKPKVTAPHRAEQAVNPFSASFEQKLRQSGRWSRVSRAMTNGGRAAGSDSAASSSASSLKVGDVIEHQRFGKGTVTNIEGSGENRKATVQFEQTGTKQLLLKFAHFKVI
jgi:DNA helicase-2/ATP-dependent DNA helicase PcrA